MPAISKLTQFGANVLRDFAVFWNIRVPSAFTQVRASLPKGRAAQDAALYSVSVIALVVVGAVSL